MEIVIKDSRKQTRVNHRKVKKVLRRALEHLKDSDKLSVHPSLITHHSSLEVSVLFVNDRRMRALNRDYRGIDRTTDVLSFPQYDRDELSVMSNELKDSSRITHYASLPLGDIVISPAKARSQAKDHGLTFYEEITRLLIHGLLHLLGYDHEKNAYQARKMRKMEEELIKEVRSSRT